MIDIWILFVLKGELKTTIQNLSDRVSWLEKNQDALVTQVEHCNRYNYVVLDIDYPVVMEECMGCLWWRKKEGKSFKH